MAITFRNAAQVVNSTASSSLSIAMPTGVVQNDVMVASLVFGGTGATVTVVPSGWSIAGSLQANGTLNEVAYSKVAGVSEAGPYAWTVSSTTRNCGSIVAYSGCDPSSPLGPTLAQANASSLTCTAPSITPARDNAMLLGCFAAIGSAATWTPDGSMTERVDEAATGTNAANQEIAEQLLGTAAATGTRAATVTVAGLNIGRLIALYPPLTGTSCLMTPWGIAEPL